MLVIVALLVDPSTKNAGPFCVFNNKLVLVPVIAALGLPFWLTLCVLVNGPAGVVNDTANGAAACDVAVPTLVTVKPLVELSVKKLLLLGVFNNKLVLVPVIAALGLPF